MEDAQESRGKYGGQAEFLLCGNVQVPHHRHGQEEQPEVRNNIAEAVYGGHVGDLDVALSRRCEVDTDVPACSDRSAGEKAEQ